MSHQAPSSTLPSTEAILSSLPFEGSLQNTTASSSSTTQPTSTNPVMTPAPINSNALAKVSPIAPATMTNNTTTTIPPLIAPAPTTGLKQENSVIINQDTRLHNSTRVPLQRNVPAFLNKLYSIVSDPSSNHLIHWSEDGTSFFVNQQDEFARKVLPRFFKHKKFSSFVRQLNMYGFHKVPHLQQGVLENESERWEFSNPHFQRNQPDLLLLVTRKKGQQNEKSVDNVDLHHIMEEIQSIKKHQMNISTQLSSIQRDNQALWQETMSARERHQRHQETIDKILRFLASVFSNEKRPAISRKRRYLLGPGDEDVGFDEQDEDEPPLKIQKQQQTFDLDDLVQHNTSLNNIDLKQNNTTDLQDAIALNDQTKLDNTHITSQANITESNPALFTPTSSSSSSSSSANPPTSSQQAALSIPSLTQIQGLQSLIALAQANPELLSQLTSESFFTNNTIAPSSSIDNVTANITHLSSSADALNQDIDDLGFSIEQLAQHLGFDPEKSNKQEDDLIDMDEFLNTYDDQMELPPSAITDLPSNATTRSPSPIVTTPGSANQKHQQNT